MSFDENDASLTGIEAGLMGKIACIIWVILVKIMTPQIEVGWMKIMLCWNRSWIWWPSFDKVSNRPNGCAQTVHMRLTCTCMSEPLKHLLVTQQDVCRDGTPEYQSEFSKIHEESSINCSPEMTHSDNWNDMISFCKIFVFRTRRKRWRQHRRPKGRRQERRRPCRQFSLATIQFGKGRQVSDEPGSWALQSLRPYGSHPWAPCPRSESPSPTGYRLRSHQRPTVPGSCRRCTWSRSFRRRPGAEATT